MIAITKEKMRDITKSLLHLACIFLFFLYYLRSSVQDNSLVDYESFTPCVLFSVYGTNTRYINEVESSIGTLKRLNRDVKVILATNNAQFSTRNSSVDRIELIESATSGFLSRTIVISEMHYRVPECHFVASLDSHVRVCSNDLKKKLYNLYRAEVLIGTNIEHAPFKPWCSSPFQYEQKKKCGGGDITSMPHNFVIVWNPHSAQFKELARVWINFHMNDPRDDQKPLRKALQATGTQHTRLREDFALALKRLHHRKIGFYPRFTYLLEGNVTMMHSHTLSSIPTHFNSDVCNFLNSDSRPRMIVESGKNEKYKFIHSLSECEQHFHTYPYLCHDSGLMHASSWET